MLCDFMQSLINILAHEKFTNPLSLNIPLWLQTLVSFKRSDTFSPSGIRFSHLFKD